MIPHCRFSIPTWKSSGRSLRTAFQIAIVAAVLGHAHPLPGQDGSGRMHGRVVDSQGLPVGEATVTARNMGLGPS